MSPTTVAVIGDTQRTSEWKWDRAAAIASAAAHLPSCDVTFRSVANSSKVQDDLKRFLTAAGVHHPDVTARTTASETLDTATIVKGDLLRIGALFGNDIVVLDFDDPPLRRFLTDLPAHTRPDVRLIAPLTYLDHVPQPDDLDVALRFDTVVSTTHQLRLLTGCANDSDAAGRLQHLMTGANLRAAVIIDSDTSQQLVTRDESFTAALPRDPSALVASVALGMARRLDWHELANPLP